MNQSQNPAVADAGRDVARMPIKKILDTLVAAGTFTIFLGLAKAAALADLFAAQGPFTVFAPTDDAFRKLPTGTLDVLRKDSAKLKALINYHTISGAVMANDFKVGEVVTLQGTTATIDYAHNDVRVNGAMITLRNLIATNGLIHAIDAVIVPRTWPAFAAAA